ncbi:sensor histidine kinase [Paenibacillus chartarius]|uniref:histidine kinase n=1 Tax=Paenibacillus chartarius TaxID=747481 RepID=A0ABV6DS40_9BACL
MFWNLRNKMTIIFVATTLMCLTLIFATGYVLEYVYGPLSVLSRDADEWLQQKQDFIDNQTGEVQKALSSGIPITEAAVPETIPFIGSIIVVSLDGKVLVDTSKTLGDDINESWLIYEFSANSRKSVDLDLWNDSVTAGKVLNELRTIMHEGKPWGLYIIRYSMKDAPLITNRDIQQIQLIKFIASYHFLALLILFIVSIFGILLLGIYRNLLVKPIQTISAVVGQIAKGDLAARVHLKNERNDEIGHLAENINTMTARLQGAISQMESADAARRYMVAAASHDLRTPLTAVLAHTEAIKEGVIDNPEQSLALIHQQGKLMQRLLDDLFELASLDANSGEWHMETVNLCEYIRSEIIAFMPQFELSDFAIEVDIPESPIYASLEKRKMERVLINLFQNACKYGSVGQWVGIRVWDQGETVRIEVQDKGPGIPADEQQRIFDRFYRADLARSSKKSGSGLGLSIVQEIIARHGGKVGVCSPAEGGACFWFELPIILLEK